MRVVDVIGCSDTFIYFDIVFLIKILILRENAVDICTRAVLKLFNLMVKNEPWKVVRIFSILKKY